MHYYIAYISQMRVYPEGTKDTNKRWNRHLGRVTRTNLALP